MIFSRIVITTILLIQAATLSAQGGISIKASVNKNKILIGEQFELKLEANIPENEAIRFFSVDSIAHFELLEKRKIDTSNTSGGTTLQQFIRITSFDSGHWVIPAFTVGNMATDTLLVDVGFSPFDTSQAYHDIKDIIEVNPEKKKQQWWWIAAAGLLLIIVITVLLLRKKKPEIKHVEQVVTPFEDAMKQLGDLQRSKPASREYYSSLIDIFRVYIFRKKGILSLQKTTDDLVVQLKTLGLDNDRFNGLSQSLRLSDFVKFAKYIPSPADDQANFETIKRSIEAIEKMPDAV